MYTVTRATEHPRLECRDASRTRQEFLKDSMIGSILRTFQATGVLRQPGLSKPQVQDGLSMPDSFQELANALTDQREAPQEQNSPEENLKENETEIENKKNENESSSASA